MLQAFRIFGFCFLMVLTVILSGCDDYDPGDETATASLIVDTNCSQDGLEAPCTLQAAIDDVINQAAMARQTTVRSDGSHRNRVAEVLLPPGTYTGNISIMDTQNDLSIVIKGLSQDRSATVIQGVDGHSSIIDIRRAGEIIIENLTVDGMSTLEPTETGGTVVGIRIEETKGRINNVAVNNIHNGDGSAQGIGIQIQAATLADVDPQNPPVEKHVEITQTWIRNYSRVGILADGDGGTVDIHGNTLSGQVMSPFHAPNAIQISRGVKGDVRNNRIEGARSPDPLAGAASGIIFYCAPGGIAEKNTVTGADLGISLVDSQDTTIDGNNVMPLTIIGITIQVLGFDGDCKPNLQLSMNNVVNNNNLNASSVGIELLTFSPDIAVPDSNHFENNSIIGQNQDFVGISVNQAKNNMFFDNIVSRGPGADTPDVIDQTTGNGTGGTANVYLNNQCTGSEPVGLCQNATAGTSQARSQHRTVTPSKTRPPGTSLRPSIYPDAGPNLQP